MAEPALMLPFRAPVPPVTQPWAHIYAPEPLGWRASDGSINYTGNGTENHWHNGIDYGAACETLVFACGDGDIEEAGKSSSGFGIRVIINHGKVRTLYGHLSRMTSLAVVGKHVKQGDHIGHVGSTGNSSGCHLHLSVIRGDWAYVDPSKFIAPVPVPSPRPPQVFRDRLGWVPGPFKVTAQAPNRTRVWDGPSERLWTMERINPGDSIECDGWAYGDPKWDSEAKQYDCRWYHRTTGGWVASARVDGNAPHSSPFPALSPGEM